jgi:hypothetical protein
MLRHCCVRILLWLAVLGSVIVARAESVKFVVTGDNRNYPGFLEVEKQIKNVAGNAVQFQISPGDADPPADTRAKIDTVFGPDFPWYLAVGNHDLEGTPFVHDYFNKRLAGKVNPGPAGTRETTYSFDAGDVHIAIINVYWNGKTDPGSDKKADNIVVPALREWLSADLKATTKPWKLVVAHPPAYPQGDQDWKDARHIGGSLDKHPAERDAFWAMLEERSATALICGHTHRYSKFQPPGSHVWQIDTAQARGNNDWDYDTFLLVTADVNHLTVDVYRNLQERGKFEVTDRLTLTQPPKTP